MTTTFDAPNGDLQFDNDGNLVIIEGERRLQQRVAQTLRLIQGEYIFDTARGIPYLPILNLGTNVEAIPLLETAIRTALEGIDGLAAIETLEIDFDESENSLDVRIVTDDGSELDVALDV